MGAQKQFDQIAVHQKEDVCCSSYERVDGGLDKKIDSESS